MTIAWGDIEPDDVYSSGALADPDQVAYRMHELVAYLNAAAGSASALISWDELTPSEQQLGLAIGAVIVQWMIDVDPDEPEAAAQNLHNVRRFWASSALPAWPDVPPDERQVGIDLMDAIIDWLRREGTLPVRS